MFGEVRFVVTFPNTTAAMAFKVACESEEVPGRLVPIPQSLHAGCGQAWSAPLSTRTQLYALLERGDLAYSECTICEF